MFSKYNGGWEVINDYYANSYAKIKFVKNALKLHALPHANTLSKVLTPRARKPGIAIIQNMC